MHQRSVRLSAVALLFVLFGAALTALPVSAELGSGEITGYTLNAAECTVDITAQVDTAGPYSLQLWDDGSLLTSITEDVEAGGTLTLQATITGPLGASDAGIYLVDPDTSYQYDSVDPVALWPDSVGIACAGGVTATSSACVWSLPGGTPIYSVPNGAPAYFAASLDTYTGFNLPAGTWYVTEFTGDFAKVWITCTGNPVYIPVSAVVR